MRSELDIEKAKCNSYKSKAKMYKKQYNKTVTALTESFQLLSVDTLLRLHKGNPVNVVAYAKPQFEVFINSIQCLNDVSYWLIDEIESDLLKVIYLSCIGSCSYWLDYPIKSLVSGFSSAFKEYIPSPKYGWLRIRFKYPDHDKKKPVINKNIDSSKDVTLYIEVIDYILCYLANRNRKNLDVKETEIKVLSLLRENKD